MVAQLKHPKGLMPLFFTEMWERFSYYGMRALLVLYLTSEIIKGGFNFERANALEIYAIFTSLVYFTPIIGGILADKILGQRKAIYIGAFIMAIGQFSLAISEFGNLPVRKEWLFMGLGFLIIGNGFFKPNISTIVGKLYTENDSRKDSAFTIFYMGINLGALASPLICGTLGETIDWFYGFGSAGIGMLLSTIWFYFNRNKFGNVGYPPNKPTIKEGKYILGIKDKIDILIYVLITIILLFGFQKFWSSISSNTRTSIIWMAAITGTLGILYTVFKNTKTSIEWSRISVILILCLFNIFFWAGFEQAGGTFNLFAKQSTDRLIFGFEIPASYFQSINPIAIIALAPLFSMMWIKLTTIRKNPNTPAKFGIGLLLLSFGFVVMSFANSFASDGNLISPLWLLTVYVLHTCGELCLSPIGLSMVTKLSPQKIVSLMMGLWMASFGIANLFAGLLENLLAKYLPDTNLFHFLTITSISAGVILLLISPVLKKLMKGIN